MSGFQTIIIPVISLIIIGTVIAIIVNSRMIERARMATQFILPQAMPSEGVEIPIIRAFTGIKGWGALYRSEQHQAIAASLRNPYGLQGFHAENSNLWGN